MAINSFPFVSVDGDRKITATIEADGLGLVVGSGVVVGILDELAPEKSTVNMDVTIQTGGAIVNGHRYIQDAPEILTLQSGDAQPRIDAIAIEANRNTAVRAVVPVVIKGVPAANPVAPDLTRTSAVWQTPIAYVRVPASAGNLSGATLTDAREYATGRHSHDDRYAKLQDVVDGLAGKAEKSHNHSATNITSGTLPIGRGGTGATSVSGARAAIGAEAILNSDQKRKITVSSSNPSGGSNGDIWIKY